ncbi:CTP synthetase [Entomoplasma ellychniae]|uniref:CTP synthase n=1 Tax=Entomoplasma ellychniae TaxID=2114 RepID=A0A8E2UAU7_9MOLU|nr:CTP synthase [Entomoplasma ellychniae]PPE04770.1 CTP synthetase [Entomoplasma ellychniae]
MAKYIFITGGVVSGLGKGITASSLGTILKASGVKVYMQKFDPYLNVDPGTMSPYQHGEVFVTEDGGETDLDLGHYERFIDVNLSKFSSNSAGRIYKDAINAERRGDWGGQTIQVVPHITNSIKNKVYQAAKTSGADVVITEIGGTVGDIESQPFIEAIRQIRMEEGKENVIFIHVALLVYLQTSKEYKTKPIQMSVKELLSLGIQPDIVVQRTDKPSSGDIKNKISLFCNIPSSHVIDAVDRSSIYEVPIDMFDQNLHEIVIKQLNLKTTKTNLQPWVNFVEKIKKSSEEFEVTFVGKYIELQDAYLSVIESLKIAGYEYNRKLKINWIQADNMTQENYEEILKSSKGILVPGGFGDRGIEGMILAAKYARENNIPYLGICLGMQIATISYARDVAGLKSAHSTEFDQHTKQPVFDFIKGIDIENLGGTLRLGLYETQVKKNTLLEKLYEKLNFSERHRHRYEFNNEFKTKLEQAGLVFSGIYKELNLVEVVELPNHKFYIGCQFHPEFTSRPNKPNPLFRGFVEAIVKE